MMNNAIPKPLRRLEAYAKKRNEIENCIQAMEYASDLYDMETYMQYRERYKELTGYYPGKQALNSIYGRIGRKDVKMKTNIKARVEMVKAMDTIMKAVNDEAVLEPWLMFGVADCDTTYEDLEYYCEDDTFAELMGLFIHLMAKAKNSGGLYCDGISDI